jgi:DNA polymerase-3 subunit epsilon
VKLNLTKPLAFIDLETTGVNVGSDRIIEISILKVLPSGEKQIKTRRVNPEMAIPASSTAIHGITDEDVKDEPAFSKIAKSLANFIEDSDLAGYNSNKFDIPLLVEEFLRAGIDYPIKNRKLVDVQVIFHQMEQRTLGAAYKFYCGKTLENAHSAEADIIATYEVLLAQLDKYKGVEYTDKSGKISTPIENDVNKLHEFTSQNPFADLAGRIGFNEKGKEVFNFGKHKGAEVEEVFKKESSYYSWMMNGDFPEYTKKIITEIKLRELKEK